MQEPRDGDFVAYIEALQRESAARLAQHHIGVVDTQPQDKSTGHFFEDKPRPAVVQDLDQAIGTFIKQNTDGRLVKALVAGVVGAMFLLVWLGDGGALSFLIAVALLAYAVPRLIAAFRAMAPRPASKAVIDQVFGGTGTPPSGSRK